MPRIRFTDLDSLKKEELFEAYSAIDSLVLQFIHDEIEKRHFYTDKRKERYIFKLKVSRAAIRMSLLGIKINTRKLPDIQVFQKEAIAKYENLLGTICEGIGAPKLNVSSPKQVMIFLDMIGAKIKNARTETIDALCELDNDIGVIANLISIIRHYKRKDSFITKDKLDDDGRLRAEYRASGDKDGRFLFRENSMGTGMNIKKIPEEFRDFFMPDENKKLIHIDYKGNKPFLIGALLYQTTGNDTLLDENAINYLNHSTKLNKRTREKIIFDVIQGKTIRSILTSCKSNKDSIRQFYSHIVTTIPEIIDIKEYFVEELSTSKEISNIFGAARKFVSYRGENDTATIRSAISYWFESSIADAISTALVRADESNLLQPVLQIDDKLIIQCPQELRQLVDFNINQNVRDKVFCFKHSIEFQNE